MNPETQRCTDCDGPGNPAEAGHRPDCRIRGELANCCTDLVWFRARPGRFWRTRQPFAQEIWRLETAGCRPGEGYFVDVTTYSDGIHLRRFWHGSKLIVELRDSLAGLGD